MGMCDRIFYLFTRCSVSFSAFTCKFIQSVHCDSSSSEGFCSFNQVWHESGESVILNSEDLSSKSKLFSIIDSESLNFISWF